MPVPASTGFTSEPRNVADMKNQGVEFSIGVTPVKTDRVTWSINFNGLHYKNTVTRLPEELREKGFTRGNQIMKEGGSIYDFYMVKWGGVNPDNGDAQYWIKNQATGQFELKQSADYESVNSLQYAGSAIPDLQGGFGTTLHFYNFDLALQFSYQLGGKFLDSQYMGLMHTGGNGRGWHTDIRNRWTPENRNTDVPRLQFNSQNIVATSDRFLIDASYLSLRNLSLGYNFGPEVTEKLKLSRLRYYITADNVCFQVFDRETGDLYPQVHMESMRGSFVGNVREACLEILYQIRKACFEVQDFICPQTKRIMTQVQEKYGNQLEYLWEKSPDTAVLRHEDNKKWYAVVMRIPWDRLEKGREGQVEAVNLKHDQVVDLLSQNGIYPAFHMNRRYWISVALDDTLSDEIVLELIEKSWNLTSKK